jgi:hypothetical protein
VNPFPCRWVQGWGHWKTSGLCELIKKEKYIKLYRKVARYCTGTTCTISTEYEKLPVPSSIKIYRKVARSQCGYGTAGTVSAEYGTNYYRYTGTHSNARLFNQRFKSAPLLRIHILIILKWLANRIIMGIYKFRYHLQIVTKRFFCSWIEKGYV